MADGSARVVVVVAVSTSLGVNGALRGCMEMLTRAVGTGCHHGLLVHAVGMSGLHGWLVQAACGPLVSTSHGH